MLNNLRSLKLISQRLVKRAYVKTFGMLFGFYYNEIYAISPFDSSLSKANLL